jgi:ribosomal protein S18 acetylase RimI-like enzyme
MTRILERTPAPKEYRVLCEAVGWREMINFDAAKLAVSRSLYAFVAEEEGETIGMGRMLGNGRIFFYIQDGAVRPEWQGLGVG